MRNAFRRKISTAKKAAAIAATTIFGVAGVPTHSFATSVSPVVQGLGGAGRAGVAKESAFTNPASAGLLKDTSAFLYWEKPSIAAFNSGGRAFSVGASDGGSDIKGSFAYVRNAEARIGAGGKQVFDDRSDFRFSSGFPVGGGITAGFTTRYVRVYHGDDSHKFVQGDLGAIFPIAGGLRGGVTYENVFKQEDEHPPTLGVGFNYALSTALSLYADGYKLMQGTRKNEKGWALAAEMTLAQDYTLRAGRFHEGYRNLNGWSLGFTWGNAQFSLDYALRFTGRSPRERDHIFGLNMQL